MILTLKIVLALIALIGIGYLMWFVRLVLIAIVFDNDRCRECPLKDKCQDAVSADLPTLCNNSTPLYTHRTW